MRINQVLIIPAFDRDKNFGRIHEKYSEWDAIDCYVHSFMEHLDNFGIRPFKSRENDLIYPNSLVVHCDAGWVDPKSKVKSSNYSAISYGTPNSRSLADIFAENTTGWGQNYVSNNHTTKDPKRGDTRPFMVTDKTISISISPFMVNGPDVDSYIRFGPMLGKMLAIAVADFMTTRGEVPGMMNAYRA